MSKAQTGAAYLARITFGSMLLVSVATVALAFMAIAASSAQQDRDSRDRRHHGGGYHVAGPGYYRRPGWGPAFAIDLTDLLWCVQAAGTGGRYCPWLGVDGREPPGAEAAAGTPSRDGSRRSLWLADPTPPHSPALSRHGLARCMHPALPPPRTHRAQVLEPAIPAVPPAARRRVPCPGHELSGGGVFVCVWRRRPERRLGCTALGAGVRPPAPGEGTGRSAHTPAERGGVVALAWLLGLRALTDASGQSEEGGLPAVVVFD